MSRRNRDRRERRAEQTAQVRAALDEQRTVQLAYTLPRGEAETGGQVRLELRAPTGATLFRYLSTSVFRRIERDGVWWRLAGQDPIVGTFVYLAEERT